MVTKKDSNEQDPHMDMVNQLEGEGEEIIVSPDLLFDIEEESILEEATALLESKEEVALPPPPQTAGSDVLIDELKTKLDNLERELGGMRRRVSQEEKSKTKSPSGKPWQYYKLPSYWGGGQAGWIITGAGGRTPGGSRSISALSQHVNEGMMPIEEYGPAPIPSDARRFGIYGGAYVPMLERGGAKEFPLSQILAYNWHKRPPIRGLTFPQVEAEKDKIREFECPDCGKTSACTADDVETQAAYFRHLRVKRDDGRHGYPREEAAMILESQGLRSPAKYAMVAKRHELESLTYAKVEEDN